MCIGYYGGGEEQRSLDWDGAKSISVEEIVHHSEIIDFELNSVIG